MNHFGSLKELLHKSSCFKNVTWTEISYSVDGKTEISGIKYSDTTGEIMYIWTHEDYTRKGYAREMLSRTIKSVKSDEIFAKAINDHPFWSNVKIKVNGVPRRFMKRSIKVNHLDDHVVEYYIKLR